ncbi:gamma-glutamyltransferase [Rhodococcus qingshengii]|uniref:gamma-glutamyltransferase n=1 Tax=Rhodococcus qingshengii TaxID=334542 RepID=UPI0036DCEC99
MTQPASSNRTRNTTPDLTSANWAPDEGKNALAAQLRMREIAGHATGENGAVTVAFGPYAARAGLEALKQGGTAADAALTTALAQVALTAGGPISYFGIMSLVYFDAQTGTTHTMNAEWNTVAGESDPMSIPGGLDFSSPDALRGAGEPSGRTALVGGFLKGVEAAHTRFGTLPFASLFQPAIEVAEHGVPVSSFLAKDLAFRAPDLNRLPATREIFLKPDGAPYTEGETLCQPKLAETLRRIAAEGTDYIYGGEWGRKLVDAVQVDGGKMTLADLTDYDVIWSDALHAPIGNGYTVATAPHPNFGGTALIEAQNLADVAGLGQGPHWTQSADTLRTAVNIAAVASAFSSEESLAATFPGIDFSPESRVTRAHAEKLWKLINEHHTAVPWKQTSPMHSDDVVAVDNRGNIAAITHSINCVLWGKTAINIDGISIGDPASFQQELIARTSPGERLPAPTETGILFKDGKATLGFASMNVGLHEKTFQCLLNHTHFGMTVEESINTPDFFAPQIDLTTGELILNVPAGKFDHDILNGTGYAWRELSVDDARMGEGIWIAIERDPTTGSVQAASHNRTNSDAHAY